MKKMLMIILLFFFVSNTNDKCVELKHDLIEQNKNNIIYEDIIGTVYHPVIEQTDNTPFITADNSIINPKKINKLRWVALSRDLIYHKGDNVKHDYRNWNGKIKFGDTIIVDSPHPKINGMWVVHDTMNKRYTKRIDFLQSTYGLYGKWGCIIIKKYCNK